MIDGFDWHLQGDDYIVNVDKGKVPTEWRQYNVYDTLKGGAVIL